MYLAFFPMTEAEAFNNQCVTDKDAMRFLDKLEDFKLYNMDNVDNVHQFVTDNNSGALENMVSFSFDFGKEEYNNLMSEIVAEDNARKEEEARQAMASNPFETMFSMLLNAIGKNENVSAKTIPGGFVGCGCMMVGDACRTCAYGTFRNARLLK